MAMAEAEGKEKTRKKRGVERANDKTGEDQTAARLQRREVREILDTYIL
jgi:hypothetical protein